MSIAKAEADYAVGKEKCNDKAGNDKKGCVNEAKAAEARAKADAKAKPQTSDPNKPTKETSTGSTSKEESPGDYGDDVVITAKVKAAVFDVNGGQNPHKHGGTVFSGMHVAARRCH